jgi:plastocyanin domain-containing protein
MAPEWLIAAGALGLMAVVTWSVLSGHDRRARSSKADGRRILVRGGYDPPEVHVRAGEPARLIFRREETMPCSERVVFPDFGVSVMLPPFEDVFVDLPATAPGEHEFTCQHEMLRGRIVVDSQEVSR